MLDVKFDRILSNSSGTQTTPERAAGAFYFFYDVKNKLSPHSDLWFVGITVCRNHENSVFVVGLNPNQLVGFPAIWLIFQHSSNQCTPTRDVVLNLIVKLAVMFNTTIYPFSILHISDLNISSRMKVPYPLSF